MTTVLVVGGQGRLGRTLADRLRSEGYDVLRTGRRAEPGARDLRMLDVTDPGGLPAALDGVDLVLSTLRDPGFVVEEAALRRGLRLLSIGSWSLADRRSAARTLPDGPGLVVAHGGLNPGLMTMALADLLRRHPGATHADLACVVPPLAAMGPMAFASTWPALTSRPRRPSRVVDFGAPVGRRRTILLGHGEEGWLGELGRRVQGSVWLALEERVGQGLLLAANATGLRPWLPRSAVALVPSRAGDGREPKRDVVQVSRDGRVLGGTRLVSDGDYRTAAVAAVAQLRVVGELPGTRGVVGAEDVVLLDQVRPDLARAGVRLEGVPTDR